MGATARVFGNPLHPYTRCCSRPFRSSTQVGREARGGRRGAGGGLVEVEDGHFVALDGPR